MKIEKYILFQLIILCLIGCNDLSLFEKEETLIVVANFENTTKYTSDLSVLTWNIQMGFKNGEKAFAGKVNKNEEPHFDSLADVIRDSGADVILLQEVGNQLNNTQIKDQIRYLSEKLSMNYIYSDYSEINTGKNIFVNGKRGHGILTKLAVDTFFRTETLYKGRFNRRSMLSARIEYQKNKYLYVTTVHLDSRSSELEFESQFDQIAQLPIDYPRIIGGDFNASVYDDIFIDYENYFINPANILVSDCVDSVRFKGTTGQQYNAYNGVPIDNFVVDPELSSNLVDICLGERSSWDLSDHKPLLLSINLN